MNHARGLLVGAIVVSTWTLSFAGAARHATAQAAPSVSCVYMTPAPNAGGESDTYVRTLGEETAFSLHALTPGVDNGVDMGDAPARTIDLKWAEDRVDWMFIRIGDTHLNINECPHDADPLRSQAFALGGVGAGMVGLRLTPRVGTADAGELKAWIEAHTMPDENGRRLAPALVSVLASGSKNGAPPGSLVIRTYECAQTVVRSFDPDDHTFDSAASPAVVAKCGLGMEIRLNFDPTAYELPTDIAVRAYIDQEGAKFQTLVVSTLEGATDPAEWEFVRCDDKGIAAVGIDQHKPYLLRMVAARPAREEGADIEVVTASVTFLGGRSPANKPPQTLPTPEGRD